MLSIISGYFSIVFGYTRSLQLSLVAFELPLPQLEAGLYRPSGSYHFNLAWVPSSAAGHAAGAPGPVVG
jgi:hypothetical protein